MPRRAVNITVELLDGRKFEVTTTTLFAKADQYALERKFGVSALELDKLAGLVGDDGRILQDADLSGHREEHMGFLLFRAFSRAQPEFSKMSWDEFREQIDRMTFGVTAENPTKVVHVA
jgi:hypothetical protein